MCVHVGENVMIQNHVCVYIGYAYIGLYPYVSVHIGSPERKLKGKIYFILKASSKFTYNTVKQHE